MPSDSDLHETRTNAVHSETADEFRVSYESRRRAAVAKVMARCSERRDGCLVWEGARQGKGYGVVHYMDRSWLTHRLIYEAVKGRIPDGMHIDHLCRNRGCCHPDHLEAVTPRENVMRGEVGERHRRTTHCPKGHEYTTENTKLKRRGNRVTRNCRACEADWQRKHRVRKPLGPCLYGG